MKDNRFSSWEKEMEDGSKPESATPKKSFSFAPLSASVPKEEPKPAASDSEDVLKDISDLESGESLSVEVDLDCFNQVYKALRRDPSVSLSYQKDKNILSCVKNFHTQL